MRHTPLKSTLETLLRRTLIRHLLVLSTFLLLAGTFISMPLAALAAPPPQPVSLKNTVLPQIASDHLMGQYDRTTPLTIEVVLLSR